MNHSNILVWYKGDNDFHFTDTYGTLDCAIERIIAGINDGWAVVSMFTINEHGHTSRITMKLDETKGKLG